MPQSHVVLTAAQMHTLTATTINSAGAYEVIVACWKMILGETQWNEAEKIDPTSYAIPKSQWLAIAESLVYRSREDMRVSASMTWINVGPSAFDDAECN